MSCIITDVSGNTMSLFSSIRCAVSSLTNSTVRRCFSISIEPVGLS